MSATAVVSDSPSQVARVIDGIRANVRAGRLSPGHRLTEAELTEEFGVSRGPVREALRRLEADGLVLITRHRGAAIRRMSPADVRDLFAVRVMLEGGAARLAAANIDVGDHRHRMEQALRESRQWADANDVVGYTDFNERFHDLILDVASNPLLTRMVGLLQLQAYRALFPGVVSLAGIRQSARDHVAIAAAILDGNGDGADSAISDHIRRTERLTLDL